MKNQPERIYGVMQSQFSISRFYGGCTFNGASYKYDEENDALIRMDIWKAERAGNKRLAAKEAKAEREKWAAVQNTFVGFDF